jgi:hypothetical protein
MARAPLIEIREWGRPPRQMVLNRPLVTGRECDGENIADTEVSVFSPPDRTGLPAPVTAMRCADPGTISSTQVSARAPDSSWIPSGVSISAVTFPYSKTCKPSAVAAASRRASCLPGALESASAQAVAAPNTYGVRFQVHQHHPL